MSEEQLRALLAKPNLTAPEFAKVLTLVELIGPSCLQFEKLQNFSSPSLRIGITGPPGAGKSTLIGQLIQRFRDQDLKVGVIAVDPSSPFSKGAILGDRIRYSEYFADPGVFVRSVGSRGSLGGLSASTYLMVRAFDMAEFDVTLIETVGVGQSELEIMYVADFVSVVLVPESGDSVQAMKAGLLEIADHFVVNKSDRPGSESMVRELEAASALGQTLGQDKEIAVDAISALNGDGLPRLMERYIELRKYFDVKQNRVLPERLRHEARSLKFASQMQQIETEISRITTVKDLASIF